jgi:tRNA-specific 2-thiouridylase
MKTFCYSGTPSHAKTCCGLDGITDARRVADGLGIPHYVFDVEEAFTRDVIDDFVTEYARGRTPNPCVKCNSNTKFRDLLERGRALGCDGIASGHYVRMERPAPGEHYLHRGRDPEKDQAYFLWGLPRPMLAQLHFPLGELTKPEVRDRARKLGLVTADKPESQEICFVPTGDYRDLLRERLETRHPALEPGPIVDREGTVLGRHDGFGGFTVGQRRGLGGGFDEPMFVLEIRPEDRAVVVGPHEALFAPGVEVAETNWLTAEPARGDRVAVQIRHRAKAVPATVAGRVGQGGTGGSDGASLTLDFEEPQRSVTPGQSAVIFGGPSGDRVLGGGRISRSLRPATASP